MVNDSSSYSNPSAKTLKELRSRLKLTQSQLASALGTTERSIRRYEKGEVVFSLDLLQFKVFMKLMNQAGMSLDDLPDPPS
ncbi:helix-turn-helix domain-containing protein [Coleofasciculus sp. G1-WW12-02]|uniref:helix-turn-helix domain-containing protein n=1 Tax=Coleofasciculus sp. G1-WW12-02 TaxID=3068483 RepID=UPI0040643571